MIQIALFAPLVVSGIASAFWREHRLKRKKGITLSPDFPKPVLPPYEQSNSVTKEVIVIDDAAEIMHSQRVSLIALALSGSGSLVFPPFTLASIPLLSYSTFYFLKTIKRSNAKKKKSATTLYSWIN